MSGFLTKDVFEGATPQAIGEIHGATWPDEIASLASLRTELTLARSDLERRDQLRRLAAAHLPVLASFDEDLHQELLSVAATSGTRAEDLVVLNHYTDIRDIRRPVWGEIGEPDGCSMALLPGAGEDDAITGETWDMHGSAAPYVRLVETRLAGRPTCTTVSLTGCLGMAGMNEEGVGVLINNLTSTDARVGILWCALVRRMLRETTAKAAYEILRTAPMGSGHHYLISDGRDAYSVETSGSRKFELASGTGRMLMHTNHCQEPSMREVEAVPAGSTTYCRLDHLERRLGALPEGGKGAPVEMLANAFRCHQDYPRSLCVHMTSGGDPHGTNTCAGLALDHAQRRLLVVRGCAVSGRWIETTVGEEGTKPVEVSP